MKILIPYPEAADNFQANVAFTLREMGHVVLTAPPPSGPALARRAIATLDDVAGKLTLGFATQQDRWLMRAVRTFRPDIVLALTQHIGDEALSVCRRAGVRHLIAWWADSPANMRRGGLLSEAWDLLLFKDREAVAKYRRVGLNAHLMHEAMNPAWHKVVAAQRNDAVAVVGNWYAYRQWLTRRLLSAGVEVAMYGPPLPRWGLQELRSAHSHAFVVREEKSRVFGEALACLNSTHFAEGNSLNCRAFEIAGAGGLQVIEHKDVIPECFEPGREVLTFHTFEELVEHLERARASPGEAHRIRMAGAARALAEHTYRHRLEHIFTLLQASASRVAVGGGVPR